MRGHLTRWQAFSASDRRQLLLLGVLLPVVQASLVLLGLMRTRRLLARLGSNKPTRAPSAADLAAAERLAQLAAIAGRRGLVGATCLPQALLVRCLLGRRRLLPELKIGVRRDQGQFAAHAWVELQSVALAQVNLMHRAFPGFESIGRRSAQQAQ